MEESPSAAVAITAAPNPKGSQETSACDKVVNTVELLDNTLDYVPPKKTFVLQRVNKTFHNHIRGDTGTTKKSHLTFRRGGEQRVYPPLILNPLTDWLGPVEAYRGRLKKHRLFSVGASALGEPKRSSWQDILALQPPVSHMGIWKLESYHWSESYGDYVAMVARRPGVTLGSIYEAIKAIVEKRHRADTAIVYLRGDVVEIEIGEGLSFGSPPAPPFLRST